MRINMQNNSTEYNNTQEALVILKSSIYNLLFKYPDGLSNAQIGRSLGIYEGHVGHEGHVSRTLLAMMEAEGVVEQNQNNKIWSIRAHG